MTDPYGELMYNPMAVPGGEVIWDFYPDLGRRRDLYRIPVAEFENLQEPYIPKERDLDQLVRFMILCCDRKSPFWDEIEYEERLRLCMDAVSIGVRQDLGKMILKGHWWVNLVMKAYFNLRSDDYLSTWLSLKVAASDLRMFIRQSVSEVADAEKFIRAKLAAMKDLEDLDRKVADMEVKLFPHSEMARNVMDASSADEIGGYAEEFASDYLKSKRVTIPN